MTTQNLWDTAKVVLREKFIAKQSYLKKQEKTSNRQAKVTPKTTGKKKKQIPPKLAEDVCHLIQTTAPSPASSTP